MSLLTSARNALLGGICPRGTFARRALVCVLLGVLLALLPGVAFAQSVPEGMIDEMLRAYKDLGQTWHGRFLPVAQSLYVSLITVQGGIMLMNLFRLHRTQQFAGAARAASKLLWFLIVAGIGSVLVNNIGAVTSTVFNLFITAADLGMPLDPNIAPDPGQDLSPSAITTMGYKLTSKMWKAAYDSGMFGGYRFWLHLDTMVYLGLCTIAVNLSFVAIAIQIALTQIAFFIAFGISPFFVMFFTVPYFSGFFDGFLSFLIYISIKIFFLYLLLGVALSIPAAAINMFPGPHDGLELYYNLIPDTGRFVWDDALNVEELQASLIHRGAFVIAMASTTVFIVMSTIPMTFARMVSTRVSINSASWWT